MRIVTVVGARPQFIKAAAVSPRLVDAGVEELIVHTGQHYDAGMSDTFFAELGIPTPSRSLGVGSAPHGDQTGRMLQAVEQVLVDEHPDALLVYGDTNSTLAGALAAVKLLVPVAHVEAGLRSFNRRMPEEINRVVTDHCSDLLFAPTQAAVDNLRREGIDGDKVQLVGDVMYDLAVSTAARLDAAGTLGRFQLRADEYVLATIHRAENTDAPERLDVIVRGLERLAESITVVLPLHPRTAHVLERTGRDVSTAGVRVTEPLGYHDMVALERNAAVVVTDSGGVQKEAFFHRRPCVTLRDETEWVELVELGWNRLVPPVDAETIAASVLAAIGSAGVAGEPYGTPDAGTRIAERLAEGIRFGC